jgi:hypothetical protein
MKPLQIRSRRRKPARSREGAVLLIVLLMLMMATGTALYAMQATFYEQGASTSFSEASWTRSLAEGAAMASLIVVEEGGIARGSLGQNLSQQWQDLGGVRSDFSLKYGTPTPLEGIPGAPANPDSARSINLQFDDLSFANTPLGLSAFCAPVKNTPPNGPPPAPYDGLARANLRGVTCHAIYETWGGLGSGSSSSSAGVGTPVRPRTRSVITGFGETAIPTDPRDLDGLRGLHETLGMSRGYFDRVN